MATVIGLNDAKARKLWSADLFVAVSRESYFQRKYMGDGSETTLPVMMITDLEKEQGEQVVYDLSMQLTGEPVEGDEKAEGTGQQLRFGQDKVYIDQARYPVSCGGRMTRKRTVHNLRTTGRNRLKEYWGRWFDEQIFIYASGARGINPDYNLPLSWNGRANNPLVALDNDHVLYGDGTSVNTLSSAGTMTRDFIETANTQAETMGGGATDVPEMQPIKIAGGEHYVLVMHTWQAHSLKTSTEAGGWLDVQKAAAAAEGSSNPIFKNALGMIGDAIMHKHRAVVRFNNYGAGANLSAARALYLGRQAVAVAYGSPGDGMRMSWSEKELDHGNDIEICAGMIVGVKRTEFVVDNVTRTFGMMALDTYAINPKTGTSSL
jgi:N4-gp56 family major capsid protein